MPPQTTAPKLQVIDAFATEAELAHVLRVATPEALGPRGIDWKRDETGFSCELPVAGDAVLQAIALRMESAAGVKNHLGATLRFRRYLRGEAHPPHLDTYRVGELGLTATAMLYLTDVARGGHTSFPRARPAPVAVAPRRGRLALWFTLGEDGAEDPAALHEGLAVEEGEKVTLTAFLYAPRPRPAGSGLRFVCVDDGVPEDTTHFLQQACAGRQIDYLAIDARSFDFDPTRILGRGDLLYRPAVSLAAQRVEQFLWSDEVATFHADPDGPFFESGAPTLLFERAGLPVPRTFFCQSRDRALLRAFVQAVGGFPVVLKSPGGEGGVGVLRADSFPALFSLVDLLLGQGTAPLLSAFVDKAIHHRVVVVGEKAVATYRNVEEADDFRTSASDDPAHYSASVPPTLARFAVRAVKALRREFGGVDLLQHPSGRLFVLEANFPCYYPQAQRAAGIDIAGAMVDHLAAKSRALAAATSASLLAPST